MQSVPGRFGTAKLQWTLRLATAVILSTSLANLHPQSDIPKPTPAGLNLLRLEGTDLSSGIHYVRLIQFVPNPDPNTLPEAQPRLVMECREQGSKRTLHWFLRFYGSPDFAFRPPFKPTSESPYPPANPSVDLKMRFEGYIQSKWFRRTWEQLPGGELKYRNTGMGSPNLDDPRSFLVWLNSLPSLRIAHAKPSSPDAAKELVFPTQLLLALLNQETLCRP